MRGVISRFIRAILDWEKRGRFSIALLIGDAVVAAWLLFTDRIFLGQPTPSLHTLEKFAASVAVLAFILQLHAFPGGKIRWLFAKGALLVPLIALIAMWLHSPAPVAWWLGGALALLLVLLRVAYFAARSRWPDQPLEMLRWMILLGAATAFGITLYAAVSMGSGDAYWYTIMLADFVQQLHAGILPVWVGQSEFAFNGAVSPLRFAPWFQHAGGFLDLLTLHALNPAALKNATLALNLVVAAFSGYGCLRVVLPRRPGLACVAAVLWLASPGMLAPVLMGDLIMTFMAMPFLPLVMLGMYLVWTQDNRPARVLLAIGLAGTWLSHTPIALWATIMAATVCILKFLLKREWREDTRRSVFTAAIFILLGSFPVFSALAMDNQIAARGLGAVAAEEIAGAFPGNFRPIDPTPGVGVLKTIQVGYTILGASGLAVLFLLWARPRGAGIFLLLNAGIAVLTLPVPWINAAIWTHAPEWFVGVNNVWVSQRLIPIWTLLLLFLFAVVMSDERISRRTWLTSLMLLLLLGGGAWSWREAQTLNRRFNPTHGTPEGTANTLALHNLLLTRYAYGSFADVTPYASHGYMDPLLENRLLDRSTLREFVANADYAAPSVRLPAPPEAVPQLTQSGVFTAVNRYADQYGLEPKLTLKPGLHYALRLEFLRPARATILPGLLQNFEHKMMRQYILPDSGSGFAHHQSPRSFGALPTSSRVIPLQTAAEQTEAYSLTYIGSGSIDEKTAPSERFAYARFWLYTYTASDLPITVESLIPYRARTETARPAWLETPRMWIRGYRATVNGHPAEVRRSPQNVVMVALEPGTSHVTLEYAAPLWLRLAFWITFAAWIAVFSTSLRRVAIQARTFVATPSSA